MTKEKVALYFDIVFALVLFSLPLSLAIPNILLVPLIILLLLKKGNSFRFNKYLILLIVFVGYLSLKAIINKSFFDSIELYKQLLALPVLGFLGLQIKQVSIVKKGFVAGVLTAVLISLFHIASYYFSNDTLSFGNTNESIDLLLIHRPYFGFACFLAVVVMSSLKNEFKSTRAQQFQTTVVLLLVLFIFLIAARLSLLLTLLYVFIKIAERVKLSKTKNSFLVLIVLAVFVSVVLTNKNLRNRFHIKETFQETFKAVQNQEARFVVWDCASKQLNNPNFNLLTGYSNRKSIQSNLNNCYEETIKNRSKKKYYLKTKFNTHNQFLDVLLQGGIIGLLLFLGLFSYLFYSFKKNKTALFVLFSLLLFASLENIFHRQLGVYFFAIFISLFYYRDTYKTK